MSKFLFDGDGGSCADGPKCGQKCYTLVEDIWEKIERQLCKPTKKCCPPRTKARDAIRISLDEAERCFYYGRKLCDGTHEQSVINRYYKMVVREKGYCDELMCIPPSRATMDGAVCWAWPKEFYRLPKGYYEADVYIDNCVCHTHLFYLPGCNVMAKPGDIVNKSDCNPCEPCGTGSHSLCGCVEPDKCSAVPIVDEVIERPGETTCVEECSGC